MPTPAEALLRLGPGHATVGLLTGATDGLGVAALVPDTDGGTGCRGPWSARVQAFGPAGDAAADRLVAACAAWEAAGRPAAADLRLTVIPRATTASSTRIASSDEGATIVEKEHCRVLVEFRRPSNERSATP